MKWKRLIIENRTSLLDMDALLYAAKVVEQGRISETRNKKQYCFHTRFGDGIHASSFLTREGSDRIVLHYNGEKKDVTK
jgi:hypothetical protein